MKDTWHRTAQRRLMPKLAMHGISCGRDEGEHRGSPAQRIARINIQFQRASSPCAPSCQRPTPVSRGTFAFVSGDPLFASQYQTFAYKYRVFTGEDVDPLTSFLRRNLVSADNETTADRIPAIVVADSASQSLSARRAARWWRFR